MSNIEITEVVTDSFDVLRKELKDRFPDFKLEEFNICSDGTVMIRMDKFARLYTSPLMVIESRHIHANYHGKGKYQGWLLYGDIE